ncbi:MAG: glycosyltransferase family 2 protein [Fusobacteria bacterium]|nr:glycosyltransferase family 2 protein [Fusobacteriota bacterium]
MKLSVAILIFNYEKHIERTLKSIKDWADEIVMIDSYSSDNTADIASKYGTVYKEEWKGDGPQYKSVVAKCKGEWILLIDQDEVVTDKLKKEISDIVNNGSKYDVFKLRFLNNSFGKTLKFGNKFYRKSFFRNGFMDFEDRPLHAAFLSKGKLGNLKNCVINYNYENLEEYFKKFQIYTTEGAETRFKKGKRGSIIKILMNPIFRFIKRYIFQLGFLDGFYGFLDAVLSSFYTFTIYSKLRLLNIENEKIKKNE